MYLDRCGRYSDQCEHIEEGFQGTPVFVIGTPKFQDRMVILTKSCSFRCSKKSPPCGMLTHSRMADMLNIISSSCRTDGHSDHNHGHSHGHNHDRGRD